MTVVARSIRARPFRTSHETWTAIRDLICGSNEGAKSEFNLVAGQASSLISDEVLKDDPLVVRGNGPRLRVYCVYDEDAVSDDEHNEESLRWDPLLSDWTVFLPCPSEDMNWMKKLLEAKTTKFVIYDRSIGLKSEEVRDAGEAEELAIDVEGFRNL